MKTNPQTINIALLFFCFLATISSSAQAPQAIPYQAVARDTAGNHIGNQNISLRFSIHDSASAGTIVYSETQSTTTNDLGLFTVNIGQGTPINGTFTGIIWGAGAKFMQVEIDTSGGTSYIDMGTQQLLSVPYALFAANLPSGTATGNTMHWDHTSQTWIADNAIFNDGTKIGIGTATPEFKLSLENDGGLIAKGTYSTGDTLTASGTGTRMIWYPRKSAFRVGTANGSEWNNSNIGEFSMAFGIGTTASGSPSTAMGYLTNASGNSSTAMGVATIASGFASTAMGNESNASGHYATTMGYITSAPSFAETVIGVYNSNYTPAAPTWYDSGDRLFVIGNGTSSGARSNAMTVLKNGNTGIGTATPVQKLDVTGTTRTTNLQLTTGASNGYVLQSDGSGNASWVNVSTLPFIETDPKVGALNTNRIPKWNGTTLTDGVVFDNGTNVGVGTITPASKLDVEGGVSIGATYSGTSAAPSNGAIIQGNVAIGTTTAASKLDVEGNISIGASYAGSTAAPSNGAIIQGNVGIGTPIATTARLVIQAAVAQDGLDLSTADSYANLRVLRNSFNSSDKDMYIGLGSGTTSGLHLYSNNTEIMSLKGGNVGIGVLSPSQKLHVVGNTILCPALDNSLGGIAIGTTTINNSAKIHLAQGNSMTYGIYIQQAGTGWGLYVSGNAEVTGTFSKGAGTFKIDHPLDPANKYLYHSFVESPDMMNVYNGNITTDNNGFATVLLPDYFEALNKEFRYQLTVIGTFAQAIVYEKVSGNKFVIRTDHPNVEVSWQVTGIRQDAFANKYRIKTSVDKVGEERGLYIHPEAFGLPEKYNLRNAQIKTSQIEK